MDFIFRVNIYHPTSREFLTNAEVCNSASNRFVTGVRGEYARACREEKPLVAYMIGQLMGISDVEMVAIHPNSVTVRMSFARRPRVRWNTRIDEIIQATYRDLFAKQRPTQRVVMEMKSGRKFYHTNFEISRSTIEHFQRPLSNDSHYLRDIGPSGEALVRGLMEIPGITEIFIRPYQISVTIGQAFSWNECDENGQNLEDKITEVFKKVFGDYLTFSSK